MNPEKLQQAESLAAVAAYNQLVQDAGGDVIAQQNAYDQMEAAARAEIDDDYDRHLFDLASEVNRWYHWGQHGAPLPAGLRLEGTRNGTYRAAFNYPLNQEVEVRMLDRLRKHGYTDLVKEIDTNHAATAGPIIRPASRELIRADKNVSKLFSIFLDTSIDRDTPDTGPYDDAVRRSIARRTVQQQWSVDPLGSRGGSAEHLVLAPAAADSAAEEQALVMDPTFIMRRHAAGKHFMRLTEFAEAPPAPTPNEALTREDFNTMRTKVFAWLDRETGGRATPAIMLAEEAVRKTNDAPSRLDNVRTPDDQSRDDLFALLSEVVGQNSTTPGIMSDEAKGIIIGILNDFIYEPVREEIHGPQMMRDTFNHASWEDYLESKLERGLYDFPYHRPYACMGIGTSQPGSANTLAYLRAPSATPERPDLYAKNGSPIKVPVTERKTIAETEQRNTDSMTYLSEADKIRLEAGSVASLEVWTRFMPPPERRLLWQVPAKDKELPTYSSETNNAVVMVTLSSELLKEGHIPQLSGYELIAADGDKFYFAYDAAEDPYRHDVKLTEKHREDILAACNTMGMMGLAADIGKRERITAKTLARLVQRHSYQGYPDPEDVGAGSALIAPATTEEDFKVFIDKDGRFCGQCSGGAQLFQFFLKKGLDSYKISTVGGHVWDFGERSVTQATHRQTRIYAGGRESIIDCSLIEDGSTFVMNSDAPIQELKRSDIIETEPRNEGASKQALGGAATSESATIEDKDVSPSLANDTVEDDHDDPVAHIEILLQHLQAALMSKPKNAEEALKQPGFAQLILSLSEDDPVRRSVHFLRQTRSIHIAKRQSEGAAALNLDAYSDEYQRLRSYLDMILRHMADKEGQTHLRETSVSTGIPYFKYAAVGTISTLRTYVDSARSTL